MPWVEVTNYTIAVALDLDIMEANIRRLQAYCDAHGIANRPHIKTHKIPAIAQRRHRDHEGADPEVQVFPQLALGHRFDIERDRFNGGGGIDQELLAIFEEEADEVLAGIDAQLEAVRDQPDQMIRVVIEVTATLSTARPLTEMAFSEGMGETGLVWIVVCGGSPSMPVSVN